MDASFRFPARPSPIPRPSAVQSPTEPVHRESRAIRASVLDVALELGLGANGTVANWMLNNSLEEEEEEEDTVGKGPPLSATSDEYGTYSTPPTSVSSHSETFYPNTASPDPSTATPQVHFPAMPAPKARARTKSKTAKDAPPALPISEPMELIPLSKEERKKKKKTTKSSKDHGAETDTEDQKPSTEGGAGYETDDGYVSSSGKPKPKGRSRFFSLRKKSDPMPEPTVVEPVPPMPEREVFDLPIASRFATTLGANSAAPSRAATPLLPPSRPFASTSSSPSSSSANSLLTPGDQDSFGTGSLNVDVSRPFGDDTSDKINPNSTLSPMSASSQDQLSSRSPQRKFEPKSRILAGQTETRPRPHIYPLPQTYGQSSSALNSRAPSPSPIGSPFVLLTPINTMNGRASSPTPSTADIIPSADFIVPSRSASPGALPPSPNVLSYYDVPPPSPPPNGPLPRAPYGRGPPPSATREPTIGLARLRSLSQDRAGGGSGGGRAGDKSWGISPMMSPMTPSSAGGVQRGRAAPFPTQPVSQARGTTTVSAGLGPGLAARAKVHRYRDLYAIQIPPTPDADEPVRRPRVTRFADEEEDVEDGEVDIRVEEWDDGDGYGDGEEEILGVLGRFRDTTTQNRRMGIGIALERNNSGVLRPGAGGNFRRAPSPNGGSPTAAEYAAAADLGMGAYSDDDEASRYPDEDKTAGRSTMYRVEGGARETMRWSEYSRNTDTRASFMDLEKSEQARGQLVERVGAMFDLSGRERSAIPPVPKLPPSLLAAGPGGNRF
ncbi:hypothetical protein B0H13DRAFT_2001733 [Mycena leptocephala]|nr:hypothetical protein B0H13DRAFT_2001733 [Mycena leptocephala]